MDKATRSQIAKSLRTAAAKLVAKAPVMPAAPKFNFDKRGGNLWPDLDAADWERITRIGQQQVDAAFKAGFEAGYQQGVEQGAEEEAFRR